MLIFLKYFWVKDVEDLKNLEQTVPKDQVIISIPGDYSRKPPIRGITTNSGFFVKKTCLLNSHGLKIFLHLLDQFPLSILPFCFPSRASAGVYSGAKPGSLHRTVCSRDESRMAILGERAPSLPGITALQTCYAFHVSSATLPSPPSAEIFFLVEMERNQPHRTWICCGLC